ncbi:hypothetical protein ABF87_06135 [Nitrosomonas sp. JL21]|uniref:hypothetical protein n=1 Tax=Nitrosomonas sp. JL21 TaxID=153949 RepID=UPI001368A3DC|nr:hypothetical protein [Nitrosomonas sp. JL21]MBL8498331.1 hypothetical protein [Nitrosomonas sp.]MCC7090452.1 hypothetical protein [Nitrosomonas sp.]MXS77548.1 hypothetical protein [Nitrosomonas sp. JL21]
MNSRILAIVVTVTMVTTTGCTAQQLYTTGQSWQRNQCTRLMDQQERERCLANAGVSYETYKKQSDLENTQGK